MAPPAHRGVGPRPVGVVLCGGSSSRMGTDKALLGPPGRPLAGQVARALSDAGCDDVVLVGGDRDALRVTGARWLADTAPGAGPLGGIATAVEANPDRALVVGACDLPWVEGRDLLPLVDALAEGAAVAVFDLDGVPQWSVVALSAEAAAAARDSFRSGARSLHRALGGTRDGDRRPAAPGLRMLRADRPLALRDVDRPADLPSEWPSPAG